MAETAVNIAIQQLATLLIQEANRLSGARERVASIQRDLEMIRAVLEDADQQQHTNEAIKVWVKQVREAAYSIEDALDLYFYRMGRPNGPGLAGLLRNSTRFFRSLLARRWVAGQVDDLRSQLRAIYTRKNEFALAEVATRVAANLVHVPRLAALFVEESQIVGIEKPREELIGHLLAKQWTYAVLSVAGMGGLGKTTLARKVYEDPRMKQHFNCRAWVTVSQTFVLEAILRCMIKQLQKTTDAEGDVGTMPSIRIVGAEDDVGTMPYIRLVETLRAHLREKCYVVVLDDIWTTDAWEVIRCALPENEAGSRIMVTTRFANVAGYCSKRQEHVYRLNPLSRTDAWDLFCRKVFGADRYQITPGEAAHACPPELEETAGKILNLCGGLPLAIVAIGGLLSPKRRSPDEWETVLRTIGSEMETDNSMQRMKKILWLSYDDLPYNLKPCFLYFGVFREESEVKRSKVSRLWIAEGFVKPEPNKSLDKISEDYLQELVQRSLVQASVVDFSGRVRWCRVHDLMYELILSKSKQQNFHFVAPSAAGTGESTSELPDNVRRFVANAGQSLPAWLPSLSHLRSLLWLGASGVPQVSTFKSLKVLHLQGARLDSFPSEILDLFHLRYLHMRGTNIRSLPKAIGRLRNLQTLDMKFTPIASLPQGILKLKNLRHILMYETFDYGVAMPEKFGSLTSLQKLENLYITGGDGQIEELSKLTQLRKLAITKVSPDCGEALCAAIKNMSFLQSLYLYPGEDDEVLAIDKLSVDSQFLRRIVLRGKLTALPEFILSLRCLEMLILTSCNLQTDLFMCLQYLPCLVELHLHNKAYEGEELRTESGGFRRLKKLCVQGTSLLRRVVIAEGAMPNLDNMVFMNCASLERVPTGIENLKSVKELYLGYVPHECVKNVRKADGEDWDKVKHIPLVKELYEENGRLYLRDP